MDVYSPVQTHTHTHTHTHTSARAHTGHTGRHACQGISRQGDPGQVWQEEQAFWQTPQVVVGEADELEFVACADLVGQQIQLVLSEHQLLEPREGADRRRQRGYGVGREDQGAEAGWQAVLADCSQLAALEGDGFERRQTADDSGDGSERVAQEKEDAQRHERAEGVGQICQIVSAQVELLQPCQLADLRGQLLQAAAGQV